MNDEERIRLRAYEIWIELGQPEGREAEHWEQARREVTGAHSRPAEPDGSEAPAQPGGDELKRSTELG